MLSSSENKFGIRIKHMNVTVYKNFLNICFGLVAKTMLIALPVRVIYLSVPDLEWCFGMGGFFFFFFWQITCIVNVSRVSDEKKSK